MPTHFPETRPLLAAQHFPSFFQKSVTTIKNISRKTVAMVAASAVSVITYYTPSYQAGASVANWLKEITAASGLGTNFFFNIQAYRELFQQFPLLVKMPWKLSAASFFSIMCVTPNIFMNIIDEEGNYIDAPLMTLQIASALFNVGVNVVGSMELINSLASLFKNRIELQKEKLIEEINIAIGKFIRKYPQLDPNEPLNRDMQEELISLLTASNDLSLPQKIIYYCLIVGIGLLTIPQFAAYFLISYFGMRDLAEKKLGVPPSNIVLPTIAAVGNAIPGAGFSIKGVISVSKKFMFFKKPGWLDIFFALPALFSGFTTHKAMGDSLKELGYSGKIAETLKWSANLGATSFYNLPQMLALADNLKAPAVGHQLENFKKYLEDQVRNLNSINAIKDFKNNLVHKVSDFFIHYSNVENFSSMVLYNTHIL